jgi:phosphoacetylglucosamine mutase
MLAQEWEEWAEIIVNSPDLKFSLCNLNELQLKGLPLGFDIFDNQPLPRKPLGAETIEEIIDREAGKSKYDKEIWPKVIVGMDTRESSPRLFEFFTKGLECMKCPYIEIGEVTTPMLHYITMNNYLGDSVLYVENYVQAFIEFQQLVGAKKRLNYETSIAVDCANGVGAKHLQAIAHRLREFIRIVPFNTDTERKSLLNNHCGAEHVQKEN